MTSIFMDYICFGTPCIYQEEEDTHRAVLITGSLGIPTRPAPGRVQPEFGRGVVVTRAEGNGDLEHGERACVGEHDPGPEQRVVVGPAAGVEHHLYEGEDGDEVGRDHPAHDV